MRRPFLATFNGAGRSALDAAEAQHVLRTGPSWLDSVLLQAGSRLALLVDWRADGGVTVLDAGQPVVREPWQPDGSGRARQAVRQALAAARDVLPQDARDLAWLAVQADHGVAIAAARGAEGPDQAIREALVQGGPGQ